MEAIQCTEAHSYLLPVVIVFFSYTGKNTILPTSEVLIPSLWGYDSFMWNSEAEAQVHKIYLHLLT